MQYFSSSASQVHAASATSRPSEQSPRETNRADGTDDKLALAIVGDDKEQFIKRIRRLDSSMQQQHNANEIINRWIQIKIDVSDSQSLVNSSESRMKRLVYLKSKIRMGASAIVESLTEEEEKQIELVTRFGNSPLRKPE